MFRNQYLWTFSFYYSDNLLIVLCKLWRWHSPLYDADVMAEVTRDRFAVVLGAEDKQFNETQAKALLANTG